MKIAISAVPAINHQDNSEIKIALAPPGTLYESQLSQYFFIRRLEHQYEMKYVFWITSAHTTPILSDLSQYELFGFLLSHLVVQTRVYPRHFTCRRISFSGLKVGCRIIVSLLFRYHNWPIRLFSKLLLFHPGCANFPRVLRLDKRGGWHYPA
jgi:hypothetical protein